MSPPGECVKKRPPKRDHREVVERPEQVCLTPVGWIRSPYTERHGTPRQPTVRGKDRPRAMEAGRVEFDPGFIPATALRDLEGFDRVWILTYLHLNPKWGPLVRPPRGEKRRGVFATRSPHHPNSIGLSAVEVVRVEGHTLHVRGLDLIDGTPVLDVKPYVPYCDAFPESAAGWVDEVSSPQPTGPEEAN